MTHRLDEVPMSRIAEQARAATFGRTILTVIAGLLYVLGWLVAKGIGGLWFAVAWIGAAIHVGWTDARGNNGPPR